MVHVLFASRFVSGTFVLLLTPIVMKYNPVKTRLLIDIKHIVLIETNRIVDKDQVCEVG